MNPSLLRLLLPLYVAISTATTPAWSATVTVPDIEFVNPRLVALSGIPFSITISLAYTNKSIALLAAPSTLYTLKIAGVYTNDNVRTQLLSVPFIPFDSETGSALLEFRPDEKIYLSEGGATKLTATLIATDSVTNTVLAESAVLAEATLRVLPTVVSLIPILLVLGIALITHQVLAALYTGLFVACFLLYNFRPDIAFLRTLDAYMVPAVSDPGHTGILLFCFFIGSLIAMVQKSGGALGMANAMAKYASSRTSSQMATFALGIFIFFDDYASCLIVGSQMRPVTDLVFLSREKLAFLVHSTAAPPSSLVPLTSWIGMELSLMSKELDKIESMKHFSSFSIFGETIASRFFPIFMLCFCVILIVTKRDFGPMLTAERRAIRLHKVADDKDINLGEEEKMDVVEGKPRRWINAALPFFVTVIMIVVGLIGDGYYQTTKKEEEGETVEYNIGTYASAGDPTSALLWATFFGCIFAMFFYRAQNIMSISTSILSLVEGVRSVIDPVLVLILAWSVGSAVDHLGTADFVVSGLQGSLDARAIPTLVFLCSCTISFCTGTSWATMALMFPLGVPLAARLAEGSDEFVHHIVVTTISSILAGSIFGDQCSPISDTSILSALASRTSVTSHIATQLPYALLVALASIFCGYLPVGYELYPAWVGILIGNVVLVGFVYLLGTRTESDDPGKFDSVKWPFKKKYGGGVREEEDGHEKEISEEEIAGAKIV